MRDLALFYTALSDPTRLRLLSLMRGGEVCVCHLQAVLKTNQPKISRHLAYLKKTGLVEARRDGKWMHYRLRQGAEGKCQQASFRGPGPAAAKSANPNGRQRTKAGGLLS